MTTPYPAKFEAFSRGTLNYYIVGSDDLVNVGDTYIGETGKTDQSLWYFDAPSKFYGMTSRPPLSIPLSFYPPPIYIYILYIYTTTSVPDHSLFHPLYILYTLYYTIYYTIYYILYAIPYILYTHQATMVSHMADISPSPSIHSLETSSPTS